MLYSYAINRYQKLKTKEKIIFLSIFTLFTAVIGYFFTIQLFILLLCIPLYWCLRAIEKDKAKKRNKLDAIANEYKLAKEKLGANPKKLELREAALNAGRAYYSSLRDGPLTLYDEQAISNDLSTIMGANINPSDL